MVVQNIDNLYWEPNDGTNFKMLYNYNRLLKDSVNICEIYFHWIYKYSIVLLINCKSHSLMDNNYCRSYYFLFLIYFVCLFALFWVFILLCFVFYLVLTFVLCVYPYNDFARECLGSWVLCVHLFSNIKNQLHTTMHQGKFSNHCDTFFCLWWDANEDETR